MSRGGNSLSKAALETKWERLKMKRQGNLLFNFRKVVTDICLTANALASINALDPMLNCAKSEDDKMLKLAGAVVKKLGGAALTYQVTNSDQSFDGLKECLERNIEMMTRKKTHAESSDSGSESEEEQGLAAVAESSDDSSDDDDSDDSESDGGVNKHQVHMIGQRKRPRNGTDVEEEQRQVERHPQRDDQSGDRGAGGEQQEESGDSDENEYCGDDCEDPFCGEDEFGTFDCNGEYYYFDEWDEIHYYDEHGEYFYDEYGECHYIDANEYGEEVQYGEEQGQYDYQQQQQSQYIDDNRNQGSWHQAAHKKYCYGCGSESHTVPHCPDRYRGPPLKSVSSNDEQVSSKRNRNNFVATCCDGRGVTLSAVRDGRGGQSQEERCAKASESIRFESARVGD
eukprot:gene37702-46512_t